MMTDPIEDPFREATPHPGSDVPVSEPHQAEAQTPVELVGRGRVRRGSEDNGAIFVSDSELHDLSSQRQADSTPPTAPVDGHPPQLNSASRLLLADRCNDAHHFAPQHGHPQTGI